jgi:hypothetical protein
MGLRKTFLYVGLPDGTILYLKRTDDYWYEYWIYEIDPNDAGTSTHNFIVKLTDQAKFNRLFTESTLL